MKIDIDGLTETELVDLNRRIVERLRFLRDARAHVAMLQLRIGERVSFQPEGRGRIWGVITRYNKKSISVVTDDGERWTVAPYYLTPDPPVENPNILVGRVVSPEGGQVSPNRFQECKNECFVTVLSEGLANLPRCY